MIAAAARTSGTICPAASVLNRGVIASWSACRLRSRDCSRARTEARALARRRLRALDVLAEYACALRLADGVRDRRCAASAETGRQTTTPRNAETNLTTNFGRSRPTNPPCTAQRQAASNPVVN